MEGTLETVVFRDFMEHDLAFPVSEFFYALLQFWGIQLHHLTPQSILHLSIFTHFCEAFLGILPHFHLFQHFFILVPFPNATKPAVVGGCELILHPETRDEYLAYDPAGKGLEWKKFWFYVGNFYRDPRLHRSHMWYNSSPRRLVHAEWIIADCMAAVYGFQ